MKRLFLLTCSLLPFVLQVSHSASDSELYTADTSRRALSQAISGLDDTQLEQFAQGRSLFNQMWVVSPSTDTEVDGLGPLYNRLSCAACHPSNGRGRAPNAGEREMRFMLVRLSTAQMGEHGTLSPHPVYGDQLNEQGIHGVAGEGQALLSYTPVQMPLNDGTVATLRFPHLQLISAHYGDFGAVLTSARVGPAITGMGLLDMVDEADILSTIDPEDINRDGISGRPNWVWDVQAQQTRLGRFGLKANVPTLKQQIASAFVGDMSITSPLFPHESCTAAQIACQQQANGGNPELTPEQLDAITFYHQSLAIPARRSRELPKVLKGERLFHQANCSACHRPQLRTQENAQPSFLARRLIEPYTDLLLHDMGAPLSDGRPDFQANGYEWRTPPLWGIGLAETVGDQVSYLHDGRARTLTEAILWHWGEAQNSQQAFMQMQPNEREALLTFLQSL